MDKKDLSIFDKIIHQISVEPSVLFMTTDLSPEHQKHFFRLPWSCVYTANRKPDAYTAFAHSKRRVQGIVSSKDGKYIRLNQREMPFVQILGRETDGVDSLDQLSITKKLLETVPHVLETSGRILIDCGHLEYNLQEELLSQLYQIKRKKSIYIFGAIKIAENPFAQRMISNGYAICFNETLTSFLDALASQGEDDGDFWNSPNEEEETVTIYLRKKLYTMNSPGEREKLINIAAFASLLNYEDVEKTDTNINDENGELWFQQFLVTSAGGYPKWYGYRENHCFHLPRYFEEDLYRNTLTLLKDAESKTRGKKPIMLRGQTCVGKTNALGALAYRIFHDNYYPVVYIREANVNFSNISETNSEGVVEFQRSPAFEALEALLRQLEAKSDNPVPTLVIWDTSCHLSSEIKAAYDLLANLRSLGRQVQVICTSHGIINGTQNEQKGKNPYDYYDIIDVEPTLVGPHNQCVRNPDYDEIAQVRQMLIKYGGFLPRDADRMMRYFATTDTFIGSLYLFRELHQTLSRKVRDENAGQIKGTMHEIEKFIQDESKSRREELLNGVIAQQLRKELERVNKQFLLPKEDEAELPEEKTKQRTQEVEILIRSIALCTIYKEKFPVSMAIRLIGNIDAASAKIFSIIMNSSMLEGSMSATDDPMVSFRSELEARLLLDDYEGHKVSSKERISLIQNLINVMPLQEDSSEVMLVQRLIRIVGPNASNNNVEWSLWEDNFDGFEQLIFAIQDFREKNHNDLLILSELTLKRELCRHKDCIYDSKKKALYLQQALKLAAEKINSEQNLTLTATTANLYVEWANTYRQLSRIEEANISKETMYKEVYPKMERIIRQFPRKGYAYSAYLWSGVAYTKDLPDTSEVKLELLQHLCNIADTVRNEIAEGEVDGNALAEIDALADSVTMSDDRFQHSIQDGKAYGLYFRIRKLIVGEEGQERLEFTQPLNEKAEPRKRLKKIVNFIENNDYQPILERDASCMYAILNAKWLLYSKYPIIPNQENLCIGLSQEIWKDIYISCRRYLDELSRFRSPRIIYLQALAALHIPEHRTEVEGLLDELKRGSNMEPRSFHILSKEDGTPELFTGQVTSFNSLTDTGRIKIDVPGFRQEIHFRPARIGRPKSDIRWQERLQDLSVAIGPRGPQICKL